MVTIVGAPAIGMRGATVRRLSERQRQRLLRVSALRGRSKQRERRRREAVIRTVRISSGKPSDTITIFGPDGLQYATLQGERRPAPAVVSLSANPDETLKFLDQTRQSLHDQWVQFPRNRSRRHATKSAPLVVRSYWDYSSIERIGPDAALVLASQYDRFRRKGGWTPRAVDIDKWNPEVRAELDGVGFLELVGVAHAGPPYVDVGTRRILKFQANDEAYGQQVFKMLTDLGVNENLHLIDLYSCIVEAIVNTRQHAYPADILFEQPHVPNWWLAASLDHAKRRLRVTVVDHGATIPRTLPRWERYPAFARGFRKLLRRELHPDPDDDGYDGAALAVAMAVGRTATEKEYRGKGLAFIESVLGLCNTGRLSIYSRRGSYIRTKGSKPFYATRPTPIRGTLVAWDLGL